MAVECEVCTGGCGAQNLGNIDGKFGDWLINVSLMVLLLLASRIRVRREKLYLALGEKRKTVIHPLWKVGVLAREAVVSSRPRMSSLCQFVFTIWGRVPFRNRETVSRQLAENKTE